MLHKTKAIALHHVRYGESSIIATLYTENFGRLTCMVNSVRTKKPKFPATLFQPLTILEIDFYSRPTREVQRLKDAVCLYRYHSIPFSYTKSAVALFLAEVLFLVLREEESNPGLFSYLFHALQLFDTTEKGSPVFHHWFMLHLTRYLGFFPPARLFEGHLTGTDDTRAFSSLSPAATNGLKRIVAGIQCPPDMSDVPYPDRMELLESLIMYYNMHVDGFSGIKSYSVLHEVFRQKEV